MEGINLGQNWGAQVCTSAAEPQPPKQSLLMLYDNDRCYQWPWEALAISAWESVTLFISQCVSDHFLCKGHECNDYGKRYCFSTRRDRKNQMTLKKSEASSLCRLGNWSPERRNVPPSVAEPVCGPAKDKAHVHWCLEQACFYQWSFSTHSDSYSPKEKKPILVHGSSRSADICLLF